jgi:L-malate glycosyltransferase
VRILHTAHSYFPEVSGVAEVVGQISTRLARRGHEVHIATGVGKARSREETVDGVRIHRFDVRGNAVMGMRGEVAGYVKFVCGQSWDVLAAHCAQTWTTDALLEHVPEIRAPEVFVGHGLSALHFPTYRDYFARLAVSLSRFDRTVALSELLEEAHFCAEHGLHRPQVIPNGVDLAQWAGQPTGIRQRWAVGDRPWLLSVSNHSPVKSHGAFREVVRLVRARIRDATATIIGGHYPAARWGLGRVGIKGGCWYRCRSSTALQRGVALKWDTPRADVVSSVQEADLVLVTSSREASPLVVLESMAAGTPWVSFDVGCVRENHGGVVVKSVSEMVEIVVELLSDPALRQRLGDEGRARVAERHDWDAITDAYELLYRSLGAGASA